LSPLNDAAFVDFEWRGASDPALTVMVEMCGCQGAAGPLSLTSFEGIFIQLVYLTKTKNMLFT